MHYEKFATTEASANFPSVNLQQIQCFPLFNARVLLLGVAVFFFSSSFSFASSEPQWCGNGYIADDLNYDVENSALEKYVIQSFGKWRHWINCYGQNCVKTQLRHLSPWFGLSWLVFSMLLNCMNWALYGSISFKSLAE